MTIFQMLGIDPIVDDDEQLGLTTHQKAGTEIAQKIRTEVAREVETEVARIKTEVLQKIETEIAQKIRTEVAREVETEVARIKADLRDDDLKDEEIDDNIPLYIYDEKIDIPRKSPFSWVDILRPKLSYVALTEAIRETKIKIPHEAQVHTYHNEINDFLLATKQKSDVLMRQMYWDFDVINSFQYRIILNKIPWIQVENKSHYIKFLSKIKYTGLFKSSESRDHRDYWIIIPSIKNEKDDLEEENSDFRNLLNIKDDPLNI